VCDDVTMLQTITACKNFTMTGVADPPHTKEMEIGETVSFFTCCESYVNLSQENHMSKAKNI
jgi:hypothetical protein